MALQRYTRRLAPWIANLIKILKQLNFNLSIYLKLILLSLPSSSCFVPRVIPRSPPGRFRASILSMDPQNINHLVSSGSSGSPTVTLDEIEAGLEPPGGPWPA